ncbi:MAG: hypothetical protein ABEI96_04095 [Haloarculaceae archaeon]
MSRTSDGSDVRPAGSRIRCFETGKDTIVVYDRERPDAWIESDVSVSVDVV